MVEVTRNADPLHTSGNACLKSRFPQGDPATQVTPHRWPQETNPDPDTPRLLRVDAHLNNTQARTSLSPFSINHTVGGAAGAAERRCTKLQDATFWVDVRMRRTRPTTTSKAPLCNQLRGKAGLRWALHLSIKANTTVSEDLVLRSSGTCAIWARRPDVLAPNNLYNVDCNWQLQSIRGSSPPRVGVAVTQRPEASELLINRNGRLASLMVTMVH